MMKKAATSLVNKPSITNIPPKNARTVTNSNATLGTPRLFILRAIEYFYQPLKVRAGSRGLPSKHITASNDEKR